MTDTQKTAPLSPQLADKLLDLLSTDDLFRARFQQDHLAALRTIGYESPEPEKMTACGMVPAMALEPFKDCKVTELAPKDAIKAARDSILAMLTRGLTQTTPNLDASSTAERRILK